MKSKTFRGGIHPPYRKKRTAEVSVKVAPEPELVTIPMSQHIGAPAKPLVKKKDYVYFGQKVGEANGFVSVPAHASVSGTVVAVEPRPHANGDNVMSVVIESDGQNQVDPAIKPFGNHQNFEPKEVISIIQDAGIVGLGGAMFPTHVKLSIPPDKKVDCIVLNGAECEPYVTADHHLMMARPKRVLQGLRIAMYATGVTKGYIGVEDNKPEAIEKLREALTPEDDIEIVPLETKYPQGGEKQLINAVTGREVPSGGLPADAGVVVLNVATASQIAVTFETGMPLYSRLLTCTGDAIKEARTFEVKIGTPLQNVIDLCGGFESDPYKVIMGGPMMGIALFGTDVPAIKGTSCILCLTKKSAYIPEPQNCIRCGKCTEVCPIHLQPLYLSAYAQKSQWANCEELHALDCIECGSCSFICPAKRTLVSSIRVAKREINDLRRKGKI